MSHCDDGLRRTPLHEVHERAGASFTDFGGWQMPLRYSSDLAEHRAVRTSAGIFDLSHMGEVYVRGPQAAAALDYALVGLISSIKVGRARYSMIVTSEGGIIDDLIVYHVSEQEFLVVPNAGNRLRVAEELRQRCAGGPGHPHFECEVEDRSDSTALIAVQGPRAEEILRGVVTSGAGVEAALRPDTDGDDGDCGPDVLCGPSVLRRLRYYAAVPAIAAGHSVLLARTGYTGEDGFEIILHAEDAADVWTVIVDHAATLPPTVLRSADEVLPALTLCGLACRDSLRLEAGMPLYGHELSEDITPYDAGLGSVVSDMKEEFIGQEALAERATRDGEPQTRLLIALAGEGRRAARAGCDVLTTDGDSIGVVTSGLLSPTLGHPIALALVRPPAPAGGEDGVDDAAATDEGHGGRCHSWPVGTTVSVDVRGKRLPMSVVASPFYKRAR